MPLFPFLVHHSTQTPTFSEYVTGQYNGNYKQKIIPFGILLLLVGGVHNVRYVYIMLHNV